MQTSQISYEQVRASEEIATYIRQADAALGAMGYTEHSFAHVTRAAEFSGSLLEKLGYPAHVAELARIAGYMHDIGNVVNRIDHSQSGAIMAFRILDKLGMDAADVALVISAIGNHDEKTAFPVNEVAAALILADKTDVRRSRVREKDQTRFDIHDRVNYSVEDSNVRLDTQARSITLEITIDPEFCAVMEYFEIFMDRMQLCKAAASYFQLRFHLQINGQIVL